MTSPQETAFTDTPDTIGNLTLRPLTAGTLILLKQTKNPLMAGGIGEEDREFHVAAFLYIHAGDPKAVRKAAANDAAFREAVLEFADGLTVADFAKAAMQIKDICERSMVGMNYEVEDTGGSDAHPNA